MNVFRHYDQAALELEYDGGARNPELNAMRDARAARIDAEAAEVRASAPAHLDVVYGPHPREKIDVFTALSANAPVLAFIHGGYWRQRSKDEFAWMAPAFTRSGVAFASIGYPLCPEVRIGDILASVRRALVHLAKEAAHLGIDPARIHVGGHSAGGHLAAMMATTDFSTLGVARDLVKSATCVSGLYDLEPLRLVKVNQDLKLTAADVVPLSPVRMTPQPHVRIATTVGSAEGNEFLRNTTELTAAWKARGASVIEIAAPGFYHFDILDEMGRAGRPIHAQTLKMIAGNA